MTQASRKAVSWIKTSPVSRLHAAYKTPRFLCCAKEGGKKNTVPQLVRENQANCCYNFSIEINKKLYWTRRQLFATLLLSAANQFSLLFTLDLAYGGVFNILECEEPKQPSMNGKSIINGHKKLNAESPRLTLLSARHSKMILVVPSRRPFTSCLNQRIRDKEFY